MSILSEFEDRVSRAIEGMFAGVFRSPVQPAELARACAKETDRQRKLGVGKVYAPTLFSILLSPRDAEALGGFADTLAGELETYITAHARAKGYEQATRPRVKFLVDETLKLGRFEVIGEILSADQVADEVGPGADLEVSAAGLGLAAEEAAPLPATTPAVAAHAAAPTRRIDAGPVLAIEGARDLFIIERDRIVLGRLDVCDLQVVDQNVSREHAAIEREGAGWIIEDLGSLNGTFVNGERIDRVRLLDGDRITLGVTNITFLEGRAR